MTDPSQLMQATGYCKRSIDNHIATLQEGGEIKRKKYERKSLITSSMLDAIETWLTEEETLSCQQIANKLQQEHQLSVSAETVRTHMRDHGLKCRRKQSKPNLKDHHKLRRIHWCEAHLDWPWEFVVFTDESYFQLERNTIKLWSRHRLDGKEFMVQL